MSYYGHSRLSMLLMPWCLFGTIWHQDIICKYRDRGRCISGECNIMYDICSIPPPPPPTLRTLRIVIKPCVAPYIYSSIYIYIMYINAHMCIAHAPFQIYFTFVSYAIHYENDNFHHRYCGPLGTNTLDRIVKFNKSLQDCPLQKLAFIHFLQYDDISVLFSDPHPPGVVGVSCVKQIVKYSSIKGVNNSVPTAIHFSSA